MENSALNQDLLMQNRKNLEMDANIRSLQTIATKATNQVEFLEREKKDLLNNISNLEELNK